MFCVVQKLEMDIGEVDQALEQMRGSIVNTYDNTLGTYVCK